VTALGVLALSAGTSPAWRLWETATVPPAGFLERVDAIDQRPNGLVLQVQESPKPAAALAEGKHPEVRALSEEETAALLARLPAAKPGAPSATPGPVVAEAEVAPSGPPPPNVVATLPVFPAHEAPTTAPVLLKADDPPPPTPPPAPEKPKENPGPLEVVRWFPTDQTWEPAELTIVFSHAMAEVGPVDAPAVPAHFEPAVAGSWRWSQPTTLSFKPDNGFPGSTTFQVEVTTAARSLSGKSLVEPKRFSFNSATLRFASYYPATHEKVSPKSPVAIEFTQRIDPVALLASTKVTINGEPASVHLATEEEILDAKRVDYLFAHFLNSREKVRERLLVVKGDTEWPRDASVAVEIVAGAKSAEGPNPTSNGRVATFRTLAPLQVTSAHDNSNQDWPYFQVQFNNLLDYPTCMKAAIEIAPAVSDLVVECSRDTLQIRGNVKPEVAYSVKLPATIADVGGQTLGQDVVREWKIGRLDDDFGAPDGTFVLEPSEKPEIPVVTRGHQQLRVRLWRVEPKHYEAVFDWKPGTQGPGEKVLDEILPVSGDAQSDQRLSIDLTPAMIPGTRFGHVVAEVLPEDGETDFDGYRAVSWVQSTSLGLDAFVDQRSVTAFVTDLVTGRAASDVEVSLHPAGLSGRTDARGIVVIATPPDGLHSIKLVIARRGDDSTFIERSLWGWDRASIPETQGRRLAWYVADDRGTYRPGEEVALKGWIRAIDHSGSGDVELQPGVGNVKVQVQDARGTTIAETAVPAGPTGSFDARLVLSKEANLGPARINLWVENETAIKTHGSYTHVIDIREFRRPEFEVRATTSTETAFLGDKADLGISARYFGGGPLPDAPVTWAVTKRAANFVPPGRDDYRFGAYGVSGSGIYSDYEATEQIGSGKTDADGSHRLRVELAQAKPAVTMQLTSEAEVTDVNRQVWKRASTTLVHPAALYVGMKTELDYLRKGSEVPVSLIVVDHNGEVQSGAPVDVKTTRASVSYQGTSGQPEVERCFVTSGPEPSTCVFHPKQSGRYEVVATVSDDSWRLSQTMSAFYVSGNDWFGRDASPSKEIQLSPHKTKYRGGETARIDVALPFYPAEALLTVRRNGIIERRHERFEKPRSIDVRLDDAMAPNVFVQVDAVGAQPREKPKDGPALPPRPVHASKSIELDVAPEARRLHVEVKPWERNVRPSAETGFDVVVRDSKGRPVAGAEVGVFVVDESVLAISGHRPADPLAAFHPERSSGTVDLHSRGTLLLRDVSAADLSLARGGAYGEAEMAEEMPAPAGAAPPVSLRQDFRPLAAFFPALTTDGFGRASASFVLPDSVTRYRIVAIAASGANRFGTGDEVFTARLPLTVRPSAPRFLNYGDAFDLPIVVQNQSDRPEAIRVAVRTSNLSPAASAGRELVVPAHDRVELRFPSAAGAPGSASIDVIAASATESDAASVSLPVHYPAARESYSTDGVIDEGAVRLPLALPPLSTIRPEAGELQVSTASTNLQALTEALLYLVQYPYECGEQMSSRILGVVAMEDVLAEFRTPDMPAKEAIRASVEAHVTELGKRQNTDGGFVFWTLSEKSNPFVSAHATHALVRAKERGYAVDAGVLSRAHDFLKTSPELAAEKANDKAAGMAASYALYVRSLLGDVDEERVRNVLRVAGGAWRLPLDSCAWMLAAVAGTQSVEKPELLQCILGRVREQAGRATFPSDFEGREWAMLRSAHRGAGIAMEALIRAKKDDPIIPRLVAGLLANRRRGLWSNTQDNVFALLALDRYFRTYENVEPDFVARLWLGDRFAGEQAFRGRSAAQQSATIPMGRLSADPALTIGKEGAGRLYWRAALRLTPASLDLGPASHGFLVEREYASAGAADDVVRRDDGTWRIKLGARVHVTLRLKNEGPAYQVALADPLPAGLEPVEKPKKEPVAPAYGHHHGEVVEDDGWTGPWYEHENLRDDRVEVFSGRLLSGNHEYRYTARATTPGTFVVPPARAEEMYTPEIFGRSASTRVVVE
jgi:uncharacterized protein YfaS (alpha-2-macroglobulin family)